MLAGRPRRSAPHDGRIVHRHAERVSKAAQRLRRAGTFAERGLLKYTATALEREGPFMVPMSVDTSFGASYGFRT
jgi:hypothetical protein